MPTLLEPMEAASSMRTGTVARHAADGRNLQQAVAAAELDLLLDTVDCRTCRTTPPRKHLPPADSSTGDDEPTPPPATPAAPIISADPHAGPEAEQ